MCGEGARRVANMCGGAHLQLLVRAVQRERNGLVQPLGLEDRRVRLPVRTPQPVDAELSVVNVPSEVASVRPELLPRLLVSVTQALVNHVPDEPALNARLGGVPDHVPVQVQVPVGVAHRVAVLAQDHGAVCNKRCVRGGGL